MSLNVNKDSVRENEKATRLNRLGTNWKSYRYKMQMIFASRELEPAFAVKINDPSAPSVIETNILEDVKHRQLVANLSKEEIQQLFHI